MSVTLEVRNLRTHFFTRAGVIKAVELPATRDAFIKLGSEVIKSTPEEVASRIRADLDKWKKVQQKTGIFID